MEVAVAIGFPPIQQFYVALRPHRQEGRLKVDGVVKLAAASEVLPFNVIVLEKIHITSLI